MKKSVRLAEAIVATNVELSSAEVLGIELLKRDLIQTRSVSHTNDRATDVIARLNPMLDKIEVLLTKLSMDKMPEIYQEIDELFTTTEGEKPKEEVKVVGRIELA